MRTLLTATAATIAFAAATPAAAVNFVTTGSTSTNGTYGNAATFASQTGGFNVRASAWHAVKDANGFTYTITNGYLGKYSSGLGDTAAGDGDGSSNNLHTVDNSGGYDFILLQFDRIVTLTGADLTAFAVSSSTDNDAWVGAGKTALAWTSTIDLAAAGNGLLAASLINGGGSVKSASGTPATRSFASYSTNRSGNVWIIGADFKNLDGIDGFKINNIVAVAAVPEPASWAMMIGGFALAGAAVRRRRTALALA
ncbi:PEPxxWA-CTERM sorting domain-containing protein [Sphingomonas tabacisoli]|uniref:PEPxxWA-CTERM sorting domain-containing protein n=1 Tax=Sphingomonas tabacisoli TaxID=2249466 RepID=A0ABW4I6P3_9SPHN